MQRTSDADTSAGRSGLPACVADRARELLDLAGLKLLAFCLGANAGLALVSLGLALLLPPHLHYLPGAR